MALGIALGLPFAHAPVAGGGAEPFERVDNGGFDSDAGWDLGGGWAVAAGVATNDIAAVFISRPLIEPTVGGESFVVSVDGVANPAATGWVVQLYNSSTLAAQNILVAGPPDATKTNSGTVNGAYDTIRIGAVDDPGLVIDNVSLIA